MFKIRRIVLLVAVCVCFPGATTGQILPKVADTVRVLTPAGMFTGPVLSTESRSLVIETAQWPLPAQLQLPADLHLDPSTMTRLEVRLGRHSRLQCALAGGLIGAFVPASMLFMVHVSNHQPYSKMQIAREDLGTRLFLLGLPASGALIGYTWPVGRWRAGDSPEASPER